jgi:aspartyl-tRNA(Asn)/glutamyl-tRNA(Gln) amidotransferase subunit B
MEKGNLRADVNVSVRGPAKLRHALRNQERQFDPLHRQAIDYEARRQIGILEDGGKIDQETRLFDPNKGETRSMRSKEEAHDYRYFPDPDLLPLEFDAGLCRKLKREPAGTAGREEGALRVADFGLTPTTPAC